MQKEWEFDSLDQQKAVFGAQDQWVNMIEKAFHVEIGLRDGLMEIRGENADRVLAGCVIDSLMQLYNRGETIRDEMVSRLIEDAESGSLEQTFAAMDSVVTMNYKGLPIKCKTPGQQNYVKMLREKTVTICIGPAGTGKTYLAVAQAAQELKDGVIERIIMSRPAIEAGEERLGFLPGDLAQKVDPYLRPLYDALNDVFGPERADKLREKGIVEVAPLAYMRGP